MSYALLHCHSQFSLLEGLAEPEDIVAKCKEADITAVALTDIGSVSGIPQFLKAAKKNGIKPILGCELFISDYEGTVNILALNKDGWKKIIGLISFLHTNNEKSQGQLAISMENLKQFISDDLLCLMGTPRTVLYTQLFHTSEFTTQQLDEEDLKLNYLHTNWINNSWEVIQKFQALFGQKNVYLEALATDGRSGFDMALRSVRYLGKKYNIPVVASTDSRYCNKQDAADFRTMLCIGMECTLDAAEQTIVRKSRWELVPFFDSFNYYIHTREQLEGKNTPEELDETLKLAERVQEFDIIPQQQIPTFPCPNNMSADDYLLQLCREGWAKRKIPLDKKQEYGERVKKEFDTFSKAGLSSYFLIVADYVNAAKQRGELIGAARGSAAGCLISYLLGITEVDPMPYNLVFERFYNEGRNTKDHISMPDIDIDFPSFKRDNTFSYIRQKYGEDKVAQVITFIRGKGRGILKDVLRVSGRCDFELMNKMTENVPDEAAISDKLQEMEELTGSSSIIRWALENDEEAFADWVKIKEDGSLDGEYAQEFAKAIRLEGMRKAYGKHAAGLIISNSVLDDIAPIFLDKSGKNKIIAFEYKILEELGFLKVDILSVTLLDKLMGVNKILAGGDFEDE